MAPEQGAERVSRHMLQDSEDTLRRADSLLGELRAVTRASEDLHECLPRHHGAPLPLTLMRAYADITSALEALRRYRGALERTTLERVHRTRDKLREVSSATEVAATSLLDGLDHAVTLVDRLDAIDASDGGSDADSTSVRGQLRDQLFELMSCMQFQDITSQQLQHAAAVLAEVEQRLVGVAALFDATAGRDALSAQAGRDGATFDPGASLFEADTRQAVADDIFTR